ncbi:hypothetical protein K466DRAFT_582683 [Polyporus arcularius HHB13444]|uniref:Uncharacterized protein n=1 Tax=Polyporus arcularius HHB13444 TaxID=1314778 RepID=A0A5C3PQW8_9APHY|nr:hypothetical protein K466DRAFT_582683 [Polyporus arcularius HHB13444]
MRRTSIDGDNDVTVQRKKCLKMVKYVALHPRLGVRRHKHILDRPRRLKTIPDIRHEVADHR